MLKPNSKERWIEAGYDLFARQGLKDVRIERLARDMGLNKSSFYHFFGDMDRFFENILQYHIEYAERYLIEIGKCQNFDPDYLQIMIKYRQNISMHWQLLKYRNNSGFLDTYHSINKKVDQVVQPLWAAFIDMQNKPELAMKYYQFVRGRFYVCMDFEHMDYDSLYAVSMEARDLIISIREVPEHRSIT